MFSLNNGPCTLFQLKLKLSIEVKPFWYVHVDISSKTKTISRTIYNYLERKRLSCIQLKKTNASITVQSFFLSTLSCVRQESRHARLSGSLSSGHISSNCLAISAAFGPVIRGISPNVWLTYNLLTNKIFSRNKHSKI